MDDQNYTSRDIAQAVAIPFNRAAPRSNHLVGSYVDSHEFLMAAKRGRRSSSLDGGVVGEVDRGSPHEKRSLPQMQDLYQFSARFYSAMPRELRDMVYGFLLGPLNEPWKVLGDGSIVSKPATTKPLRRPMVTQYLTNGLVCAPMAKEMAELFFKHGQFQFEHPYNGLQVFLGSGFQGSDFTPRDFVRRIQIEISFPTRWSWHDIYRKPPGLVDHFEKLLERLECLVEIREPQNCELELTIQSVDPASISHVSHYIAPSVYRLRDQGFRIAVHSAFKGALSVDFAG